ncbi:MAG: HYR domain-containing protein [Saprospirales bacterium]|nr:HYR domain-containing protein [Saprospirales bacterium]
MKRILLLLALPLFFMLEANALPLPNGNTAPNWTMTDLNGVSHTLYDYLDQGKMVVIDFSATWCGPCWNYHNTHILRDLYDQYGPSGTDQLMVFFIEGDPSTPVSALYGGSGSQGNWVAGTTYPIIDDGSGQTTGQYQISYFPTLYAICSDRKIYEAGQVSLQTWVNWISSCTLDAEAVVDNADCFGQPSGSINLTATGGYGNKTYHWSNGANTEDVYNLLPGNYSVTVTEGLGRSINIQNLVVSSPSQIIAQTLSVTNVSCTGQGNGSATVGASGGTPGYTYSWSNGASGPTATNLSGGTYQVSVHDANNCIKVHNVIITEPTPLNGSPSPIGAHCGNSDGTAVITPSGGTYPYSFNIGNGATPVPVFLNLAAGNYTVTLTDSHNCTHLVPFTIEDLPGPTAAAGPTQQLNCTNAQVTLDGTNSASGNNIQYLWTTNDGHIVSGANTLTPEVDMDGTYTLEVTDLANGCVTTDEVEVTEDTALPTADAGTGGELDCVLTEMNLDGSASSQGAAFEYLWTTNDGHIISGANTLTPLVDAGGTYTLTVLNATNTCASVDVVEVIADQAAPVANGGPNGVINCNASELNLDGSGSSSGNEVTYLWTTTTGNILSGETTTTPLVDGAGEYILEVTFTTSGCTQTDMVEVTEDLAVPVADAGEDGVLNCNVSSLVLDGSHSSSGSEFDYLWTTGDGNIASGENSLNPTVDAPGTYTLEVTNTQNGCVAFEEVFVVETIPVVGSVEDLTHVACAGEETGAATVMALEGAGPYIFAWPDGSTGVTHFNLGVGTYTVTVTDTDNCTDLITLVINEPAPLTANASATGETFLGANDGIATAAPLGGVEPYSFLWSNGEITETISGLEPGNYTVIITDGNGCTKQETVTINSFTCTINANVAAQNITCNGNDDGEATVVINNGLEPFTIVWSNGTEGPTASSLTPGTYTVSITDENNCPTTANITIQEPAPVALTIVETLDATCFGGASGQATVEASGGVGNYTYLWPSGNAEATEYNLTAGTHVVILTDGNGCETTMNVVIDQPQALTGNVTSTPESAFQSEDGKLSAVPAGGTPGYHYLWSNGANTASIGGLAPGEYTVIVTDENGCTFELSGTVEEYICPEVAFDSEIDGVSCAGLSDGSASLTASGGTSPYSYSWSNGAAGPAVSGLEGGKYQVTIQDAANCPYVTDVEVPEPDVLTLEALELINIECAGQTNGAATVGGLGGTADYIYSWSTGATGATAYDLEPGFHQATVTDANGCKATLEVEIVVADDTTLPTVVTQETIVLDLDENGEAALTPAMADAGSFDNCAIESMEVSQNYFDCSQVGTHEVTLTVLDVNGNENSGTFTVIVQDKTAPELTCPEDILVFNCDGFVEYDLPAASDNCGATQVELKDGLGSGANFPIGSTTELYQAMDASGNISECAFKVTVENTLEAAGAVTATCPEVSEGTASVEAAGGTPGYAYLWNTGAETASIEGLSAGIYDVLVTDATGCEYTVQVEVGEFPAIDLVVDEVTNAQNGGQNGAIQITVGNGTPPFTFEWRDQEQYLYSTAEDLVNVPAGEYTCSITDANGCVFISDPIVVENVSGTSEPAWANGVWVYPNPADKQFFVRIQLEEAAMVQWEVHDVRGVVTAKNLTAFATSQFIPISVSHWAPGIYYLRLIINEEVLIRRVVIE